MLIRTGAADVLLKNFKRGGVWWEHCLVFCYVCAWIEEEKSWEKKDEDIEISLQLYLNNSTSVVNIPIGEDEIKSREFNYIINSPFY